MRIGIMTFHCARNYGAVLQAYALQTYLESLGHKVYVIDYRPSYLLNPYRLFRFGEWREKGLIADMKWNLREILVAPIRGLRNIRFERFVRSRLHLLKIDFNRSCSEIDTFIFGSDQIWNPAICNGYDRYFMADAMAFKGKNCIAYSASVGRIGNIKSSSDQLIDSLSNFSIIGARENSFNEWLKAQGISNSALTLDPVMLVGKKYFEPITQEIDKRKPYLFLFMVDRLPKAKAVAEIIAARYNLEIIEFTSCYETFAFKGKMQTKSPEYFLGMIKAASYVVTTSFHATAFSIMFEKNFTAVSSREALNERVQSLLSLFNLESRLSFDESDIDSSPIDYDKQFEQFEEVKYTSERFLQAL